MKALSIKQPWAWLICAGYKDIENRTWRTNFRGRIYVHAGKKVDMDGQIYLLHPEKRFYAPKKKLAQKFGLIWQYKGKDLGAIIGEVDIVDCKFRFGEESDDLYSVWHEPGQYGFVLKNPVLYKKPIPCRGQLGFFEPEIEE